MTSRPVAEGASQPLLGQGERLAELLERTGRVLGQRAAGAGTGNRSSAARATRCRRPARPAARCPAAAAPGARARPRPGRPPPPAPAAGPARPARPAARPPGPAPRRRRRPPGRRCDPMIPTVAIAALAAAGGGRRPTSRPAPAAAQRAAAKARGWPCPPNSRLNRPDQPPTLAAHSGPLARPTCSGGAPGPAAAPGDGPGAGRRQLDVARGPLRVGRPVADERVAREVDHLAGEAVGGVEARRETPAPASA